MECTRKTTEQQKHWEFRAERVSGKILCTNGNANKKKNRMNKKKTTGNYSNNSAKVKYYFSWMNCTSQWKWLLMLTVLITCCVFMFVRRGTIIQIAFQAVPFESFSFEEARSIKQFSLLLTMLTTPPIEQLIFDVKLPALIYFQFFILCAL